MSNRQERRRRRRVIVGDNMTASALDGEVYDASTPRGRMPEKQPGQHRWTVTCMYVLSDERVAQDEIGPPQQPAMPGVAASNPRCQRCGPDWKPGNPLGSGDPDPPCTCRVWCGQDWCDGLLDQENLVFMALGCVDCEKPFGEIKPGSACPADPREWW